MGRIIVTTPNVMQCAQQKCEEKPEIPPGSLCRQEVGDVAVENVCQFVEFVE